MGIFKCKLGFHDWVTHRWIEHRQRPRRSIFSKKGGRKKAQYYYHRVEYTYCIRCGKKRREKQL